METSEVTCKGAQKIPLGTAGSLYIVNEIEGVGLKRWLVYTGGNGFIQSQTEDGHHGNWPDRPADVITRRGGGGGNTAAVKAGFWLTH